MVDYFLNAPRMARTRSRLIFSDGVVSRFRFKPRIAVDVVGRNHFAGAIVEPAFLAAAFFVSFYDDRSDAACGFASFGPGQRGHLRYRAHGLRTGGEIRARCHKGGEEKQPGERRITIMARRPSPAERALLWTCFALRIWSLRRN